MDAAGPDIFLIPVQGRFLLHAPLHGVDALLNRPAAEQLRLALKDRLPLQGLAPALRPLAQRLKAAAVPEPAERRGPFAPRRLNLFITSDCNLACRYCVPRTENPLKKTMSRDLCAAAVSTFAEIAQRTHLPDVSIYLHGGEPLLSLDAAVFAASEGRRRAGRLGVPFHLFATTNGCLPQGTAQWAAENVSFLVVSLDGPPDVHNRQRPRPDGRGSFTTVAAFLHTLSRRGAAFGIRCTVAAAEADCMPEWTRFFCQAFRPRVIAFEPLLQTPRAAAAGLAPPPPDVFAESLIQAQQTADIFDVGIELPRCRIHRIGRCANCDLVDDQMIVLPDGAVTACFAVDHADAAQADPFIIGRCDPQRTGLHIDPDRLQRVRRQGVESMDRCTGCFCRWHCAGGCRMIHSPASLYGDNGAACRITRKLTLWKLLQRIETAAAAPYYQKELEPSWNLRSNPAASSAGR